MRDLIDVKGASGAVYRFSQFRDGRPLSPMGGNFLYVRETTDGHEIVHAGEGQNLLTDARKRWGEAVSAHGPLHLFTRLNISEHARQREQADIVGAVRPVMNAGAVENGAG